MNTITFKLQSGLTKPLPSNSKLSQQIRIDFIKRTFPEVLTCDPYRSTKLIDEIRNKLIENGFYKHTSKKQCRATDEAIIRYILKAQGRSVFCNFAKSTRVSERAV